MSPSWIKSLRGHGRSRSESTSSTLSDASLSTTSSSSSSSLASIVQTPTARKSFDDNKENTPIHHGSNSSLRRSRSSSNAIKESRSNLSSLINICKSPSKSSRTSPSPEDTDMLDPPLPEPPLQEDQPFELESTGQASPSLSPDRAAAAAAAAAGGGGTDLSPVASSNSSTRSSFDTRRSESESSVTTASSSASSPSSLAAAHNGTKFDIDACINKLLKVGYAGTFPKRCALTNGEISTICTLAREIVANQPMLLEVDPGVKVVGDIHGQYHDLLRLFNVCGFPPKSNYLFLGDYVDRGPQGLETILLLLCYKIKHPTKFNLLRGNHEAAAVTRVYGFFDECRRRTGGDVKIWKTFIDLFNCLPVAAIIAGKIFCVHGGLSPQLACMDQIRQLERPCDVTESGLLNDLLWSDPSDSAVDWEPNDRGVSWAFSKGVLEEFLQKHDLDLVCRGHMVVEDGYEFWHDRQLLTVFSAPNYVSQFDNMAAVLSVSEKLLCSFQLLEPLDGPELKREMQRCQQKHAMQNAQAIQQRLSSNLRR